MYWTEGEVEEGGFIDAMGLLGTTLAVMTLAILVRRRRKTN